MTSTAVLLAGLACLLVAVPVIADPCEPSEEDELDLLEAAVQRCVRVATPTLIKGDDGDTYEQLGKIDPCVTAGLNALEDGTLPVDVAGQISDCVLGKSYPDALMDTVHDLVDCVKSALGA